MKDYIDSKSRWNSTKRQVDTYVDVELLYADAKVVGVLVIALPIKNTSMDGSRLMGDYLMVNAAIGNMFPRQIR